MVIGREGSGNRERRMLKQGRGWSEGSGNREGRRC